MAFSPTMADLRPTGSKKNAVTRLPDAWGTAKTPPTFLYKSVYLKKDDAKFYMILFLSIMMQVIFRWNQSFFILVGVLSGKRCKT